MIIDKYYVVDFDRCLGSVDASFALLTDIVSKLGAIDRQTMQIARDKVESRHESFSVFEYVKEAQPALDFGAIESEYIRRVAENPSSLQEPGASEFIDYLKASGAYFCIMSYGDPHWQAVKIRAAGFGDVHIELVSSARKSNYISEWYESDTGRFLVPGSYFDDKMARSAGEVVLVDDKPSAFSDLPPNVRGYWVSHPDSPHAIWQGDEQQSVQTISRIDEIIALEG